MPRTYCIAPSILSANLALLGPDVDEVIRAGADMIHFDVMDNHYVPNLSFGPAVCQALVEHGISHPIDVHLMVSPVDALINDFIKAGAARISLHGDATTHLNRSLQLIKDAGLKAGLALNPADDISSLKYCLHQLDFVLVMTVNPGFGGQSLITPVVEKIAAIRTLYPHLSIQVDGGVKSSNILALAQAGADNFVAGSAIFGQEDYTQAIKALRDQLALAD